MGDLHQEIIEMMESGQYTFQQIANFFGLDIDVVSMVWEDYQDYVSKQISDSEPVIDDTTADAEVFASIGWGTDEDYFYEGEY